MSSANGSGTAEPKLNATERRTMEDLFKLRDGVVKDKTFKAIYDLTVKQLREEAKSRPGFGTIEALMIERVAAGYVIIRDREARGIGIDGANQDAKAEPPGFIHERNYREFVATWYEQASKLQQASAKAGTPFEGLDRLRADIEDEISDVVVSVVDEMLSKPEAKALKARLVEEFARHAQEVPVG